MLSKKLMFKLKTVIHQAVIYLARYVSIVDLPGEVSGVVSHPEEVSAALLAVGPRPGEVDELGGFDGAVVLELEQRQLPRYLDRMVLKVDIN